MKVLSKLVYPSSPLKFLRQVFEKQPCLFNANPAYVANLFSSSELSNVIRHSQLLPSQLELVKNNRYVRPEDMFYIFDHKHKRREGNSFFVLNERIVPELLKDGYGLIARNLEAHHSRLGEMAYHLEREMQLPVHVNGYWGLQNSTTFSKHKDSHDVFIVQVEGEKRWWVYGRSPDELLMDFVLKGGQVLYIPRFFWHQAQATENLHSFHLTVGVKQLGKFGLDNRLSKVSLAAFTGQDFALDQRFRLVTTKRLKAQVAGDGQCRVKTKRVKLEFPVECLPWFEFIESRGSFTGKQVLDHFKASRSGKAIHDFVSHLTQVGFLETV